MSRQQVVLTLSEWIALTTALETSPDVSAETLATKAVRLVENRKKYARRVVELENKMLKKSETDK